MHLVHFLCLRKIIVPSKQDEQLVVSFLKRKPLGNLTLTDSVVSTKKKKFESGEDVEA